MISRNNIIFRPLLLYLVHVCMSMSSFHNTHNLSTLDYYLISNIYVFYWPKLHIRTQNLCIWIITLVMNKKFYLFSVIAVVCCILPVYGRIKTVHVLVLDLDHAPLCDLRGWHSICQLSLWPVHTVLYGLEEKWIVV